MSGFSLFSKYKRAWDFKQFFAKVGYIDLLFMPGYINRINKKMTGRYCGSFEDQLSQMMVTADAAKIFPNQNVYVHVDIGVLFGGSVLAKAKILNHLKINMQKIIAVDPFSGYYDKKSDPVTGLPVTLTEFRKNLRIFGVEGKNIVILPYFSGNKKVMETIGKYKIISLMIDGDHSYAGIKQDWELFSPLVCNGGYVIIDDYSDPNWPEVTKFGDEIIKKNKAWQVLCHVDTTLVLKKI